MYELHLTFDVSDSYEFNKRCIAANIKPLVIDLFDRQLNHVGTDYMTVSKHKSIEEIPDLIKSVSEVIQYPLIRSKIEQPIEVKEDMDVGYYETHFDCDVDSIESVKSKCIILDLKVSKRVDKSQYIMTYRRSAANISSKRFLENMNHIMKLMQSNMRIHSFVSEHCISDDNIKHDNIWMEN